MNTSTLPSTINKDKNASLPTCVKPPFSLRKILKKLHVYVLFSTKDLSYFSAKNTILFSQQAQIPTEAGHLFCRHFLLSRVGLMTNTWAAVLKRISHIFSFLLLLKFNTTTYSGKGNESNHFGKKAMACGACKH